ncbi:pilus assembly FimT family protein [Nitratidesulfovibrio sp. 1201_IL3209]|uniref:pilus assembly FimT family protein n=1 Tax=Nitratidesulfovibrio sp. 1201_IL3209 TaxID=3084053 RepID=UPI002FD98DDB
MTTHTTHHASMPPQGGLTGPDVADGRRAPRAAALPSPVPRTPLPARTLRNGTGQRGFTMIEVVAVLVIIGILAAVAADRIFNQAPAELAAISSAVRGNIRYARTRSMNSDEIFGVQVISPSTYAVFRNGNIANRVVLPGEAGGVITLPEGAAFSATGTVFFDHWGAPCSNAATPPARFNANVSVTLSYRDASDTITITRNTGFIP